MIALKWVVLDGESLHIPFFLIWEIFHPLQIYICRNICCQNNKSFNKKGKHKENKISFVIYTKKISFNWVWKTASNPSRKAGKRFSECGCAMKNVNKQNGNENGNKSE